MSDSNRPDSDLPLGPVIPGWKGCPLPSREPLQGRFCRLEALAPERHGRELEAANAMDRDGRMWTYLPYGPFQPGAYLEWLRSVALGTDPMFFAILSGSPGKATGVASYLRMDPENGSIEVGHLAYSPSLQRTPAATEAMYLLMERAFALGYRRYEWKCHGLNRASRAAAQRLGFSYEGTHRQLRVVKGRSRDTAWFSILDREWPALRGAYLRWLDPSNFSAEGAQRIALSELTRPLLAARDPLLEGP